ncbi:hypothetical protein F4806DRAFT_451525 [Annulohypoxylon nitens]|nr:hypothetical protein F4806DRAFT_451525 [Annulohypoxylon nitens]
MLPSLAAITCRLRCGRLAAAAINQYMQGSASYHRRICLYQIGLGSTACRGESRYFGMLGLGAYRMFLSPSY